MLVVFMGQLKVRPGMSRIYFLGDEFEPGFRMLSDELFAFLNFMLEVGKGGSRSAL